MSQRKNILHDVQTKPDKKPKSQTDASGKLPTNPAAATWNRVQRYVSADRYQDAIDLLRSAGHDVQIRNALGVCLMRAGRLHEAVNVFRELVLQPGCTWMRLELPTEYKTNFALALLLDGYPAGSMEMLAEINDESNPSVRRLRAVMARWEHTLSFWQRLNWRMGKIPPRNKPVEIDFVPGNFDIEVVRTEEPDPTQPVSPVQTAA